MLTSAVTIIAAEENVNPLVPALPDLVWGTLAFVIVLAFFWWKVLPSMNAALDARRDAIEGGIQRADGQPQGEALREALVTRDRKLVYRIDDGIPVLLAEEAIATGQVADFPPA